MSFCFTLDNLRRVNIEKIEKVTQMEEKIDYVTDYVEKIEQVTEMIEKNDPNQFNCI